MAPSATKQSPLAARTAPAAAQAQRAIERRSTFLDLRLIPERAVLCFQQHQLVARVRRSTTGVVAQHQREQAVDFGLIRHQLGENAAQANGFTGQIDSTDVALVVNELHDSQYGRESFGQQLDRGAAERNTNLFDPGLGACEPALHGLGRDKEGVRDVLGAEAADSPQRKRDLGLARERWRATREYGLRNQWNGNIRRDVRRSEAA